MLSYFTDVIVPVLIDIIPASIVFFCCLLISHYVLKSFNFRSQITKYFLLHFFTNMYVVYLVLPDVMDTITDPVHFENVSIYPSFITLLFHTYHILFYDSIPRDEKVHHLVNVYVTIPSLWFNYNKICNYAQFFMMGLPGGITYLLLFMKDIGLIDTLTEKLISKHLNLWIRCPGAITIVFIIYIQILYCPDSFVGMGFVSAIISMMGTFWNGIYFMQTIVESHVTRSIQHTASMLENVEDDKIDDKVGDKEDDKIDKTE